MQNEKKQKQKKKEQLKMCFYRNWLSSIYKELKA